MSKRQVKEFVVDTRAELSATLDEIEHRLSPQQLSKQGAHWVHESYDRNPVAWLIAGGAVVIGAVAAVLWALLGDD